MAENQDMQVRRREGGSGKWSYLILGLSLGMVLGGAAMWWMENYIRSGQQITYYQYNPLDTLASYADMVDLSGTPTDTEAVALSGENDTTENSEYDTSASKDYDPYGWLGVLDTLSGMYYTPELLQEEEVLDDYRQWPDRVDTLRQAMHQVGEAKMVTTDNAPVLRDELLFVRQLHIQEEAQEADGNLVRKPAGTKPLRVEFWRSPINYTGYRMSESKLVLFGIFAIDSVMLVRRDNQLWVNVMDERYPVVETFDFKPLVNQHPKTRPTTRSTSRL